MSKHTAVLRTAHDRHLEDTHEDELHLTLISFGHAPGTARRVALTK